MIKEKHTRYRVRWNHPWPPHQCQQVSAAIAVVCPSPQNDYGPLIPMAYELFPNLDALRKVGTLAVGCMVTVRDVMFHIIQLH